MEPPVLLLETVLPVLRLCRCRWRLLIAPASAAASAHAAETCSTQNSSTKVGAPLLIHKLSRIPPVSLHFPLSLKSSGIMTTRAFILSLFFFPLCLPNWNDVSPLQPASTGGPQQRCQTPAGQERLATRSRARLRCTGEPGATALFSLRSSWTRWRNCSCRTSIRM